MDRRGVGLLVVVLGLLTAVVVPNSIGRGIAGVAQAVPVPTPPAVGTCVRADFDPSFSALYPGSGKYQYPELTLADCGQPHSGEVVSVITDPAVPKITTDSAGSGSVNDPNVNRCWPNAGRYVGLLDDSDPPDVIDVDSWGLAITMAAVPMTPTVSQRVAGAGWLACVTYAPSPSDIDNGRPTFYRGTLQNAASTGVARDQLGSCPKESDWTQATSYDCTQPHHAEIFGTVGLREDAASSSLMASCKKMVETVTKNADLVEAGQLAISVRANTLNGQPVIGSTVPKESTAQCGVVATGGRMLRGSLVAIGTDPIPWS